MTVPQPEAFCGLAHGMNKNECAQRFALCRAPDSGKTRASRVPERDALPFGLFGLGRPLPRNLKSTKEGFAKKPMHDTHTKVILAVPDVPLIS